MSDKRIQELNEICVRLQKTNTDGKDKVKALEQIVQLMKTLKDDLHSIYNIDYLVKRFDKQIFSIHTIC